MVQAMTDAIFSLCRSAFNIFKLYYLWVMKLDFLCLNSVEIINQKILPNLSIIGNISKYTSILIINGENDSQTTVQQAFLLQQRLTDVEHPNHTLITYPNLGH